MSEEEKNDAVAGATASTSSSSPPPVANGAAASSSRPWRRVPSATSLLPPTSDRGLTAADLIAHQQLLEAQAREAIPFSYALASCTYSKGYIRQPLWACKDCGGGAVCAGCSIGCHAEHELVELFAKRGRRCDCGCPSLQRLPESTSNGDLKPCNLRQPPLHFAPENDGNVYGKNFDGHFCYCERGYTYDPNEEEETMFQCVVCEEWLHETCTSLRPRRHRDQQSQQPQRVTTRAPAEESSGSDALKAAFEGQDEEEEDPPPLIAHESFDTVICDACIRRYPILHHYIGVNDWGACLKLTENDQTLVKDGASMVKVAAAAGEPMYSILGLPVNEEYDSTGTASSGAPDRQTASSSGGGAKRELSPIVEGNDDEEPDPKRTKVEAALDIPAPATHPSQPVEAEEAEVPKSTQASSSRCRLPPIHPLVSALLSQAAAAAPRPPAPAPVSEKANLNNPDNTQRSEDRLDVFLNEGEGEGEGEESHIVPDETGTGTGTETGYRGFRRRICRCHDCLAAFTDLPFLLDEEETYSPPASETGRATTTAAAAAAGRQDVATDGQGRGGGRGGGQRDGDGGADDDEEDAISTSSSHHSTYDLGLEALNRLPRAQTLEAMEGYGRLRTALFEHLRPFAQSGRPVDEQSIRTFFEEQRARDRASRGY